MVPRATNQLQTAFNRTLTATAEVYRRTSVADTTGGYVDSYVLTHTYPCSYHRYPQRPLDQELQPRIHVVTAYDFVFADDVDILSTDRLVAGGRTFEVVEADMASLALNRHVYAQEIL